MKKERHISESKNTIQQEDLLSPETTAIFKILTNQGILEDQTIDDETIRQVNKNKKRKTYHNTLLLLQHYRDIIWTMECFPNGIAEELEGPVNNLDALLSLVNTEISFENKKLENRLQSAQRSRLLLDRINEALTVLRQKPGTGEMMYKTIYETYITPEKLSHTDILYRLNISSRHYYRIRQQAINILSIRLWAVPNQGELDSWLEIMTLLEDL